MNKSSHEVEEKVLANADALCFEETLAKERRQLKESSNIARVEQREEAVRQQARNNNLEDDNVTGNRIEGDNGNRGNRVVKSSKESSIEVIVPLTHTTKHPDHVSQSITNDDNIKKEPSTSPTKGVPSLKSSSVKAPPPPPAKPPRNYDHNVPLSVERGDAKNEDMMIVKSPVVVEQLAGNVKVSDSAGPSLVTFVPKQPVTPVQPGLKPPMSLATSTPKTSSHVSFSNTVTEIPHTAISPASSSSDSSSSSGGVNGTNKPKKIPPPPPPRKSSRNLTASAVVSQPTVRSPSPPAYENINTLKEKAKEKKKVTDSPKAFHPFTKHQKSRTHNNMNGPDSEEQNLQPDSGAKSPEHVSKHHPGEQEGVRGVEGSDTDSCNSAHATEIVQISGTVRRRTPTGSKETSPSPQVNSVKVNKDPKKVPPPPPVRKTSALTDGVTANGEVVKVGNGSIMGNGDSVSGNALSTVQPVDIRSLSPASLKRYEETEIY